MSVYNRLLIHLRRLPLPGRQKTWAVRLKGNPNPLYVRLGTSDWYVLEEIFLNDEYGPLVKFDLKNVNRVLDLGANIGMSVRLWQTLWPVAKIAAVEPDANNLRMAKLNAIYSESPSAVFLQACAAGKVRPVHLNRDHDEYGFQMRDGAADGESIPAMTIEKLCRLAQWANEDDAPPLIDLLKCDIEGAEAEVFAQCAAWAPHVRYFAVEVHAPYTADALLADLRRAGVLPIRESIISKGDLAVVFLEAQCASPAIS